MALLHDANMPQSSTGEALPTNAGQGNPETLIERVLKHREQMKALDTVHDEMNGTKKGKNEEESLAASIVNKALDVNLKTNQDLRDEVRDREKDVNTARAEADKAKADLYTVIGQQIGGAMDRLEKIQEDMRKGVYDNPNRQKSLVDQVKEAKDLLGVLTPAEPRPSSQSSDSMDFNSTIALERLKQGHEVEMRKLDLQIEQMKNDFQWKMAELTDNKKQRDREYEDSRSFRQTALQEVGDIAAGIAASMGGGGAGVAAEGVAGQPQDGGQPPPGPPPPPGVKPKMAYIQSFPCQKCGEPVAIPKEGNTVACTTDGCGMVYTIKDE